jgi:Alkylmercury lyase
MAMLGRLICDPVMPDDLNNCVRVRLYELFIALGRSPSLAELAADLGRGLAEVSAAVRELAAAHVLVLQPDSGEVLMAAPLSAVPTPFLVETEEAVAKSLYGNCIWDALGVLAILRRDGKVIASCGCCGESMHVTVSAGRVQSAPGGAVHFAIPARHW